MFQHLCFNRQHQEIFVNRRRTGDGIGLLALGNIVDTQGHRCAAGIRNTDRDLMKRGFQRKLQCLTAFNVPVFIGRRMQSAAPAFQMETACAQHQHRGGKQYFVHILPFSKAQSR